MTCHKNHVFEFFSIFSQFIHHTRNNLWVSLRLVVGKHDDVVPLFHLTNDLFNIVLSRKHRFFHIDAGTEELVSNFVKIHGVAAFVFWVFTNAHFVEWFELKLVGAHAVRHGELNSRQESLRYHIRTTEFFHFFTDRHETGLASTHILFGEMFQQGKHTVDVLLRKTSLDFGADHLESTFEFRLQSYIFSGGSNFSLCLFDRRLERSHHRRLTVRHNPRRCKPGQSQGCKHKQSSQHFDIEFSLLLQVCCGMESKAPSSGIAEAE
mmetsp:Transcript_838/g.2003  ORF Transcript_838/g.2003 Transcript_838/m.2003 type:complete len:265 (+) Transcript_838:799-1593(+)